MSVNKTIGWGKEDDLSYLCDELDVDIRDPYVIATLIDLTDGHWRPSAMDSDYIKSVT